MVWDDDTVSETNWSWPLFDAYIYGSDRALFLSDFLTRSRDDCLVFGRPDLGTLLDPSKITKCYLRPAMVKAGITKPGAWHLLRHTSLTATAAVSVPAAVQARAGHSSYAMTQKYVHMAQVAHPDATIEQAESRLLGGGGRPV